MNDIAIKCANVTKSYRVLGEDGKPALLDVLQDVSFEIERGSFTAIVGPSGCGKSTLLRILGMLETPTSGTLTVKGEAVDCSHSAEGKLAALRNRYIGFVFQSHRLMSDMSAIENIMVPLLIRGQSLKEARGHAHEALAEFFSPEEIAGGVASRRPRFLSGGQCQRVATARAIVGAPEVILADEPTGSLDPQSARRVIELLRSLQKKSGLTVLMVTHNMEHAHSVDQCLTLRDGRMISQG